MIRVRPDPMRLAATLSPLVRGVVEGLVGSAILVAEAASPELSDIADASGCRVLIETNWPEGFARVVASTGGAPLLLLDTGLLLGQEFWPMLADRLSLIGDRPAATDRVEAQSPAIWLRQRLAALRGHVDADAALLLPGSAARMIAQAKGDPWQWRFGRDLVRLPVRGSRVP